MSNFKKPYINIPVAKIKDRPKALTIEGELIVDMYSFYHQINTLFMQEEDWSIAESLDALDDLLYGSYGILKLHPQTDLIWRNHKCSADALGRELTGKYYLKNWSPDLLSTKHFLCNSSMDLMLGAG